MRRDNIRPNSCRCPGWFRLLIWGMSMVAGVGDAQAQVSVTGLPAREMTQRWQSRLRRAGTPAQVQPITDSLIHEAIRQGYLTCRIDSMSRHEGRIRLHVTPGPRYLIRSLVLREVPPDWLEKSGLMVYRRPQPLDWARLETRLARCLTICQQQGYTFAAFRDLDMQYERQGTDTIWVSVQYRLDMGDPVRIDSIHVTGPHREQDAFIYSLIRLAPGDRYDQSRIDAIPQVLNNSLYFKQVQQADVRFTDQQRAVLTVAVQPRQSGKVDILLGILPSTDTTDRRLQVSGLMDVRLVSLFRLGEVLSIRYNKLPGTSQQTRVSVTLPYLLRIPVQAEGEVDFLKQESAFLNLNAQAAAAYVFSPYLSARFYYRSRSSRLLDAALADTAAQPAQLDARRQTAGAGLIYENLDYRTSPTRGLSARLEIGLGSRQIRPNVRLPEALYDTLDLSEPIRELALDIRLYRRVLPRQVLYLGHQSRWLGMQQYYRNDQFQIGGARSVRGFNENQFFADLYLSWTAEYRFLLAQDSYLFVLGDYAWLRDRVQEARYHLTGAGLGFTWATRAGLLSLTYATGRTGESTFQPARGRIHIGFINEF